MFLLYTGVTTFGYVHNITEILSEVNIALKVL
jgi:hypothetical protein